MYNDKILYGKNPQEGIVGLEVADNLTELFIQDETGKIESKFVSNKFWILSNRPLNKNFIRLEGDLHYKWGIQFEDRESFGKFRRIWKNEDIYSIYNPKEAFMVKDGYTYYKGLQPKDISILSFDIETTGLNHDSTAKLILITNTFRKGNQVIRKLFCYDEYQNEGEMLAAWCKWVKEVDPSIITGHNIISYDLPYMQFIADKHNVSINLGRNGSDIKFDRFESGFRIDQTRDLNYKKVYIYGREIIDTMFLAIKSDIAAKKYESYGLKQIIKQENLEQQDRQFYDASKIRFNYTNKEEMVKIKKYAETDADDGLKLFDLFCPPFFYSTQMIPKSFQSVTETASGGQINSILVRSYLQDKHSIPKADEIKQFQGGISLGIPGIYKRSFKIDISSSYPSAILINKLYSKHKDPKAHMLYICESLTKARLENKKLYKETNDKKYYYLDQTGKIFINSIFGFCSAAGLNFNDPNIAAKITEYGREYLNLGMIWATGKDKDHWISLSGGENE